MFIVAGNITVDADRGGTGARGRSRFSPVGRPDRAGQDQSSTSNGTVPLRSTRFAAATRHRSQTAAIRSSHVFQHEISGARGVVALSQPSGRRCDLTSAVMTAAVDTMSARAALRS